MEAKDYGKGLDIVKATNSITLSDKGKWKARWTLTKFKDPSGEIEKMSKLGASIEDLKRMFDAAFLEEAILEGNLLLNEGIQNVEDLLAGLATPTKWDATNARVGVGDSSAAAAATQTGLQATVNTAFVGMDSGYPSRSGQTLSWKGTFGSDVANFAWNEFTVDNGATPNINLNRLVSGQGTKTSGQTWILTLSITIS